MSDYRLLPALIEVSIVSSDDCLTCDGATIAELAAANILVGKIDLCADHARTLERAINDVERARNSPDSRPERHT